MLSDVKPEPLAGREAGGRAAKGGGVRDPLLKTNNAAAPGKISGAAFKRVRFISIPSPDAKVLLSFGEPFNSAAVLENLPAQDWPALAPEEPSGPDFDCAILILGSVNAETVRLSRDWIDPDGDGGEGASLRARAGKSWVRCRHGRVVLCAAPDNVPGFLAALAEFLFYEHELRKLEREIAADWPRAEGDLSLANDVKAEDLKRLGDIGAMTRSVWLRRIKLARIERLLHKTQAALPVPARGLAAKLRARFDVSDRAETLDGQIEVYEYIYEMANQRMGEFGNFRREYLLEILIVLLLASELTVMIWEFIRHYNEA